MLLVDLLIVQVALPSIQRDLHAGFTGAPVGDRARTALTLTALLLSAGTLADRFSRKHVFLGGVVVFTLASLACALAGSPLALDLARAVQGVGGAAMFTTSLALIGQEFEGRARHTAIALWGSTIGGAVAVGPVLGGALTELLSWHWVFYVNLPIGVAVFVAAAVSVRSVRDPHAVHADVAGLVTFSGALFLFVYGVMRGNDDGWTSATILGVLAGAAVLLAAFAAVELRQTRPMLDLSLLRSPAFTGTSLGTFAIGAGDVRALAVPDALSPEHPRLLAVPGRTAVAAGDRVHLPRPGHRVTDRVQRPGQADARRRPRSRVRRPTADVRRRRALALGPCSCRGWSSAGSGSALRTRRSGISRSQSCRRTEQGCHRGSTTPSGSEVSRSVSRRSGRCSRVGWRLGYPRCLPTAPHGLAAAVASGGTRAACPPSPGRPTAPRSWKLPAARSRRDST